MKTLLLTTMKPCENKSVPPTSLQSRSIRRSSAILAAMVGFVLFGALPGKGQSYSIWNDSFLPAVISATDNAPLTVGVKFQSAIDGYVTGIRFYKATGNTGNNVGSLWTADGTLLASTTFTNETAGGWQEQLFAGPVAINSNTTYLVSCFLPSGYYAATAPYFNAGDYVNAPLVALGDGVAAGNGVYTYATVETFPANSFNSANYWVDLVFEPELDPCANDTTPPVITECASDRTLVLDENGQGTVPDLTGEVFAEDNCTEELVVTQSPTAGTLLGPGQHLVTLTVTDASGNGATCTATLRVEDQSNSSVIVGDFVWDDLNRNGIQDPGEPGLPGVRVGLFECSSHDLIATQFTDPDGYYQFEGEWTNSLYLKFDRLPSYDFSPRGQGEDDSHDSDVDRLSGTTECFVVECESPGQAGCLATNWDAGMYWVCDPAVGVSSPGYWKNHLDKWPATLEIGDITYTAAQARALIQEGGKDKSMKLFRSLAATKLNVLAGNDSSCIDETIAKADQWLTEYPPGSDIAASSETWKQASPLQDQLDAYNNGELCAPSRECRLSVGCGGGNDRPNHFRLRIDGEPGSVWCLQQSTNLIQWTTLTTLTNSFGIKEYMTHVPGSEAQKFYRVVRAPGQPSVEPFRNLCGTFMDLKNNRRLNLFPVVYEGDLIIRGNHNLIKGAPNGETVIAGNLVIYGNANRVCNLKVLGKAILQGNVNTLQDVEVSDQVVDTGNGNMVASGGCAP